MIHQEMGVGCLRQDFEMIPQEAPCRRYRVRDEVVQTVRPAAHDLCGARG